MIEKNNLIYFSWPLLIQNKTYLRLNSLEEKVKWFIIPNSHRFSLFLWCISRIIFLIFVPFTKMMILFFPFPWGIPPLELLDVISQSLVLSSLVWTYRVFIKYSVFFPYLFHFSELCKFCCSACVWPDIVYTHWHQGETERGQSPEYILKSSKNHNIYWTPCTYGHTDGQSNL